MPNATASAETKRFELESCPGGYVVIRKLTYGEDLHIRGLSARMHMQQEEVQQARKEARKKGRPDPEMSITIDVDAVTAYQFGRCIVDHNLEDENGRLLNFSSRQDFYRLDKTIGEEIERYVMEVNPTQSLDEDAEDEEGKPPLKSVSGEQSTKAN